VPLIQGDAHLLDRVVVAGDVQPVSEEQQVRDGDMQLLLQLGYSVGLVDSLVGDIARGGATASDFEVGELRGGVGA
jgi:hypothetical protein